MSRNIATCYDKTTTNYQGFILFDAVRHWLCNLIANVHQLQGPEQRVWNMARTLLDPLSIDVLPQRGP